MVAFRALNSSDSRRFENEAVTCMENSQHDHRNVKLYMNFHIHYKVA